MTAIAILACAGVAAVRVRDWARPGAGLARRDVYPQPTVPLPEGTTVLRLPPGGWRARELMPARPAVLELPLRLVFPPPRGGEDSTRYEALYLAPPAAGAVGAPESADHHIVLLADSPQDSGEGWRSRAAALTRSGQWCLIVALSDPDPPSDSLVVLLTEAARRAE